MVASPRAKHRRADAHLVLEQAPADLASPRSLGSPTGSPLAADVIADGEPCLLTLSARHPDALVALADATADAIEAGQPARAVARHVADASQGADRPSRPRLETLLEARPSDEFLNQSLDVLRLAVGEARAENIVELCLQVANASGGFMNVGNVSAEERERIAAIAEKLGPAARDAFHRELG